MFYYLKSISLGIISFRFNPLNHNMTYITYLFKLKKKYFFSSDFRFSDLFL